MKMPCKFGGCEICIRVCNSAFFSRFSVQQFRDLIKLEIARLFRTKSRHCLKKIVRPLTEMSTFKRRIYF